MCPTAEQRPLPWTFTYFLSCVITVQSLKYISRSSRHSGLGLLRWRRLSLGTHFVTVWAHLVGSIRWTYIGNACLRTQFCSFIICSGSDRSSSRSGLMAVKLLGNVVFYNFNKWNETYGSIIINVFLAPFSEVKWSWNVKILYEFDLFLVL